MASTDAKPIPQKNVAYRITFPIFDADGDLVTGATGLDSEISKDGGTFTDCSNEATEIATSSGMYYLDLTNTEMNADTVAVIIKTSTSGAKTTPIVMYPEEAGDIRVNATQWNSLTTVALPLVPTTAGRTLDVSAGGEAGIDWANIGSPTTAVNLSATNIDVDQVVASVSGAVGSVTGNVGGNVTGSVGSVTGLTNATIADAVWDEDATAHQTQGTFGQAIGDPGADTDTIWALVNTNLNATISSRASQTSLDTLDDFVDTEIAAIISTLGTPAGASISADIAAIEAQTDDIGAAGAGLTAIPWNASWDAEVQSEVADALTAFWTSPGTLVDLIWDEPTAGHSGAGTTGKALTDAGSAGDPWTTALPGAYGAGTAGNILGNNLDAAITSRMATYTQPTGFLAATFPATVASTTNITAGTITTVTNLTNAPTSGDLTATMKTSVATAVWDAATASYGIAGSYGLLVETNLDATVSSRLATAGYTAPDNTSIAAILVDTAEIGVAGAGLTNINLPNQTMDIVGNITGNLSGSVGSVTGLTAANLDAAISTRATPAQVNAEVVDALATDTYTEPTGAPGVTVSLKDKIGYIYMALRNKLTVTSSAKTFYDDGGAAEWSKALSDDGTEYTEYEGA